MNRYIKSYVYIIYCALTMSSFSVHTNIFDDALHGLKQFGSDVESAGKSTIKTIEKVGKKAAKSAEDAFVDAGKQIKKTALEAALAAERAAFATADATVKGSLIAAEKSAQAGLDTAQAVLDAAKKSSPVLLRGPATASQDVLKGLEKSGVGVLKGGEWVIDKGLGQIDITRFWCETTLEALKLQVISDMRVEYSLFGKNFTTTVHFNLHNTMASLLSVVDTIIDEIERKIIDPLEASFTIPRQTAPLPVVPASAATAVTQAAEKAAQAAEKISTDLQTQEQKSAELLAQAVKNMQKQMKL